MRANQTHLTKPNSTAWNWEIRIKLTNQRNDNLTKLANKQEPTIHALENILEVSVDNSLKNLCSVPTPNPQAS